MKKASAQGMACDLIQAESVGHILTIEVKAIKTSDTHEFLSLAGLMIADIRKAGQRAMVGDMTIETLSAKIMKAANGEEILPTEITAQAMPQAIDMILEKDTGKDHGRRGAPMKTREANTMAVANMTTIGHQMRGALQDHTRNAGLEMALARETIGEGRNCRHNLRCIKS